jgi:hypothetical protein
MSDITAKRKRAPGGGRKPMPKRERRSVQLQLRINPKLRAMLKAQGGVGGMSAVALRWLKAGAKAERGKDAPICAHCFAEAVIKIVNEARAAQKPIKDNQWDENA